jgi:deoxyribose-phosphate aldolase
VTDGYANIDLAPLIDHTLLSPLATAVQVEQWCNEADRYKFAAVCIAPVHVRQAVELLHNKRPQVCTVIGFPWGATTSATKLFEAQEAAENGAQELDVVINLGWLRAGLHDAVHRELAEIRESTDLVIKAILETTLLTDPEKKIAAELCMDAGVSFLKTSTGGIRTAQQAIDLVQAGAMRLGTSHGVSLLQQMAAGPEAVASGSGY